MSSRATRVATVVVMLVALSACSTAESTDAGSSPRTGAIELAVSETCSDESDGQCESVNGESVLSPSAFVRAGVEDAVVVEGDGQNVIDVTFDPDGAQVFHQLSKEASEAEDTARLVMKAGDELLAVVAVMEVVEGAHVRIGLDPEKDAHDLVALISEG